MYDHPRAGNCETKAARAANLACTSVRRPLLATGLPAHVDMTSRSAREEGSTSYHLGDDQRVIVDVAERKATDVTGGWMTVESRP